MYAHVQAAVEAEMYQSAPSIRASVLEAMLDYILGAITSVVTEQLAGVLAFTNRARPHLMKIS